MSRKDSGASDDETTETGVQKEVEKVLGIYKTLNIDLFESCMQSYNDLNDTGDNETSF